MRRWFPLALAAVLISSAAALAAEPAAPTPASISAAESKTIREIAATLSVSSSGASTRAAKARQAGAPVCSRPLQKRPRRTAGMGRQTSNPS